MRVLLIILISLFGQKLASQSFDKDVCNCIKSSFRQIDFNYFETLNEVEKDLITNNIIGKTTKSIVERIESVSKSGSIEESRSYENIILEQLGLRTVKYCINLHTYGKKNSQPTSVFRLMRELDFVNSNIPKPVDLKNFRKESAKTLLKYQENNSNSKLYKLIQLEYLYWFTETEEMKGLVSLPEFGQIDQDTINSVNINVNSEDKITFENNLITVDQICDLIKSPIEDGKGIYFSNERMTKYKLYLEVYNTIKDCIQNMRNDKSNELFGKSFEDLGQEQKNEIMKIIPMKIFETEPR